MTPRSTRLHHRNLPLLLLQARERVISHFRPILNANGVTEQQWRIVRVLYEVPSLEPREIVELCRISSPSMAGFSRAWKNSAWWPAGGCRTISGACMSR